MGEPAFGTLRQHRHEAMAAVEGNGVQPARRVVSAGLAREGQQCALHRVTLDRPFPAAERQGCVVAQACGAGEANEIALRCYGTFRCIALARDGEGALRRLDRRHHHLVAGQRAGLVGADHRDGTDGLDRGQAADDGVAPRHGLNANRQRDGHHRGQPLGNCRHRNAHDGHEQFGEVLMPDEIAIGEQQARGEKDQERQPPREVVELRDERRRQLLHIRQQPADAPDFRRLAGRHHEAARRALRHQRARPQHGCAVSQRRLPRRRFGVLLDRNGFARQDRLLDGQSPGFQNPQIGWHLVARLQQHDVAGHQFRPADSDAPAAAQDGGARRQHGADGGHRRLRLALLHIADHRIGQNHGDDHRRVHPVLQARRHHGGTEQHIDQHIVELRQEPHERPAAACLGQAVGAMHGQPPRRLVRTQAFGSGIERGKAGGNWLGVRIGQRHVSAPCNHRR